MGKKSKKNRNSTNKKKNKPTTQQESSRKQSGSQTQPQIEENTVEETPIEVKIPSQGKSEHSSIINTPRVIPESPNTVQKRAKFREGEILTPAFLPVPHNEPEFKLEQNIQRNSESLNPQEKDNEAELIYQNEEEQNLEDPIKDLSSSLRIITFTFSLLLLLTLLSNLYYLTFLNSFSRSLGMINHQYNSSFEKIASIERYQNAFYKPDDPKANGNWKENRFSYPGVPQSRKIDNWQIFRQMNFSEYDDDYDEPAVREKMGDSANNEIQKQFEKEKALKIPVTKHFRINFLYNQEQKLNTCYGGAILAMRRTDKDDSVVKTEIDFDSLNQKLKMRFKSRNELINIKMLREGTREGVIVGYFQLIRFWVYNGSIIDVYNNYQYSKY